MNQPIKFTRADLDPTSPNHEALMQAANAHLAKIRGRIARGEDPAELLDYRGYQLRFVGHCCFIGKNGVILTAQDNIETAKEFVDGHVDNNREIERSW